MLSVAVRDFGAVMTRVFRGAIRQLVSQFELAGDPENRENREMPTIPKSRVVTKGHLVYVHEFVVDFFGRFTEGNFLWKLPMGISYGNFLRDMQPPPPLRLAS